MMVHERMEGNFSGEDSLEGWKKERGGKKV